eukprot:scaffold1535_cov382-Prasinococcus_capsulatus_cf.AAC.30
MQLSAEWGPEVASRSWRTSTLSANLRSTLRDIAIHGTASSTSCPTTLMGRCRALRYQAGRRCLVRIHSRTLTGQFRHPAKPGAADPGA